MSDERLTPFDEGAAACPFIAFEDDRDHRADRPDYRHRCFAATQPEPRALPHQERYCLAVGFPQCPVFLDWARQEAAAVLPAGRRLSSAVLDDNAGARSGRVDEVAPAFLAGRPRPTPTDDETPAPRRTPESVGGLWGYQGDVKRPAADTAAASTSDDEEGLGFAASAGASGAASSATGARPGSSASRGTPSIVPSSGLMAKPAATNPAWAHPPKPENFPRLRSRDERSSNSPLLLAMVGVAVLLVAIFVLAVLPGGGSSHATATPSSSASLTNATPTATVVPTDTPGPSGSFTIYTVKSGDSLYSIEVAYGVTQEAILALNPQITNPAVITIGEQIKIPNPGSLPSASASASAS